MINHVSLGTSDVARAAAFYDPVMATLGIRRMHMEDRWVGYGTSITFFSLEKPIDGRPASVGNGARLAFTAETRAMVDAFHRAAIDAGGSDEGSPGLRPDYDPNYYAAFVLDPDGNKIEAVSFASE